MGFLSHRRNKERPRIFGGLEKDVPFWQVLSRNNFPLFALESARSRIFGKHQSRLISVSAWFHSPLQKIWFKLDISLSADRSSGHTRDFCSFKQRKSGLNWISSEHAWLEHLGRPAGSRAARGRALAARSCKQLLHSTRACARAANKKR